MTFSVWNGAAYDYYTAPGGVGEPPQAKHLRYARATEIGMAPDDAAWPLPVGAKKIGSGKTAKGMIASAGRGRALGDVGVRPRAAVALVAVGGLLYLLLR